MVQVMIKVGCGLIRQCFGRAVRRQTETVSKTAIMIAFVPVAWPGGELGVL